MIRLKNMATIAKDRAKRIGNYLTLDFGKLQGLNNTASSKQMSAKRKDHNHLSL